MQAQREGVVPGPPPSSEVKRENRQDHEYSGRRAMWFHTGDSSSGSRASVRLAIGLFIPASLILWLLYTAQTQEEARHGRNLRWLAQMATQITDRVQVRSDFVRDSSRQYAAPFQGLTKHRLTESPSYSVENLTPLDPGKDADRCKPEHDLTVVAEGQEQQLLFVQDRACAKSNLKMLVDRAIRKDAFHSIILAQRDGKVLYQSGPDSLRITNVEFLFASGEEERPNKSLSGTSAPREHERVRGKVPASSIHLTSRIGDAGFEIFAQPMQLGASFTSNETGWVLIGISEKHNLLHSSAPNGLMVIVPLVLLLLGITWPLQRVWFLSPLDSFRRSQTAVIGVCSLGAILILSLLGISEYSRHTSMERADDQLRRFAQSLGRNLTAELKLAVEQLHALDDIATPDETGFKTSVLEQLNPKDIRLRFEYADWIDNDGNKIVRWTTRPTSPQLVKVADRSYFQEVITGASKYTIVPGISPDGFAIEHVLSRTSGEAVTMLGIPAQKPGKRNIRVASLAVNLVSLADAVAPKDLGFAIIDRSAKVLFHSDPSRMFVENLLAESQDSGELQGVISRRIPAFLNLDYDASPHRMLVTPIPGAEQLNWTLVVFRKLAANRIGRMQTMVDTFALLFVYGIGIVLAMVLARLLRSRGLWPRYASFDRWLNAFDIGRVFVAGAGMALVVLLVRAFDRLHGADLFWAALLSSIAFLLIHAVGLRYRIDKGLIGARLKGIAGVSVILVVLGLCAGDSFMMGVAPAIAVVWGLLLPSFFALLPRDRHRRLLRAAWLLWGVEIALILCVAPALMMAKLSQQYELGLRLRDSQWRLWTLEDGKRKALIRAIDGTPGVKQSPQKRMALLRAVGLAEFPGAKEPRPIYYYGAESSRISLAFGKDDKPCASDGVSYDGPRSGIASAVAEFILARTEIRSEDRLMGMDARQRALEPAGGLWRWEERGPFVCLESGSDIKARAELPRFNPFLARQGVAQASSEDTRKGPAPFVPWAPAWLALLSIAGGAAVWMNALWRRLLMVGVSSERWTDPAFDSQSPAPVRLFLIAEPGQRERTPPANLSGYEHIDLALGEIQLDPKGLSKLPPNGLLLDRFEARFQDPQVRNSRLELLETAILAEGTPIAIRSAIDCVTYLSGSGDGIPGSEADANELKRWCALLSHFERGVQPRQAEGSIDYAAIWDSCSDREKDVLMQIVRHGLANPSLSEVVGVLLRRGLLYRAEDMGVRFFHVEFRRFVAGITANVREKKRARSAGRRLPSYVIVLLLVGVVLIASQEELTTQLIGFLTTITGGFEAARKQLAGIQELTATKNS